MPRRVSRMKIKRVVGDLIEIPTSKGLAYVQHIFDHKIPPVYGSLIRVLQGFYKTTPSKEELQKIVALPHRFVGFCPVYHAIKAGIFKLIGNFPVPEFARKFPVFKATQAPPKSDPKEVDWWLWDGEKEWKVGKLSEEDLDKYPYRGVFNDTALITSIETGMFCKRKLC